MCCGMKIVLKSGFKLNDILKEAKSYADEITKGDLYYETSEDGIIQILNSKVLDESIKKEFYKTRKSERKILDTYNYGDIVRVEHGGGYIMNKIEKPLDQVFWVSNDIGNIYTKHIPSDII